MAKKTYTLDINTKPLVEGYRNAIKQMEAAGMGSNFTQGLTKQLNELENKYKELQNVAKGGFKGPSEIKAYSNSMSKLMQSFRQFEAGLSDIGVDLSNLGVAANKARQNLRNVFTKLGLSDVDGDLNNVVANLNRVDNATKKANAELNKRVQAYKNLKDAASQAEKEAIKGVKVDTHNKTSNQSKYAIFGETSKNVFSDEDVKKSKASVQMIKEMIVQASKEAGGAISEQDANVDKLYQKIKRTLESSDDLMSFASRGGGKTSVKNAISAFNANQGYADMQSAFSARDAALSRVNEIGTQTGKDKFSLQSNLLAELRTAAGELNTELIRVKQTMGTATASTADMDKAAQGAAQAYEGVSGSASKIGDATMKNIYRLKEQADVADKNRKAFQNLKNSFLAYFSAAAMISTVRNQIRETYNDVKQLDKSFASIAMVTSKTLGEMWSSYDEYASMAAQLGQETDSVVKASALFYQQGLDTKDALSLTADTMKLATLAGNDYKTATQEMTAALRGFKMEMSEGNRVMDVYSELAAHAAATVDDIAQAMSRTASIANSAGMSFENTSAFLTKMIETTQESAENIGTSLKTIIARFTELKENVAGTSESEFADLDFNKVDKALKSVGVSLKTTQGQFRDLDEVFLELSQKWSSLDRNTQRYVATIAAGSRQQSRFIAMMEDYDRTVALINQAADSEGKANEQFAKYADTMEYKLNQLNTKWEEFKVNILNSDIFKGIADALNGVVSAMGDIANNPIKLTALIGAFALAGKTIVRQFSTTMNNIGTLANTGMTKASNALTKKFQSVFKLQPKLSKEEFEALNRQINEEIEKLDAIIAKNPLTLYSDGSAETDLENMRRAEEEIKKAQAQIETLESEIAAKQNALNASANGSGIALTSSAEADFRQQIKERQNKIALQENIINDPGRKAAIDQGRKLQAGVDAAREAEAKKAQLKNQKANAKMALIDGKVIGRALGTAITTTLTMTLAGADPFEVFVTTITTTVIPAIIELFTAVITGAEAATAAATAGISLAVAALAAGIAATVAKLNDISNMNDASYQLDRVNGALKETEEHIEEIKNKIKDINTATKDLTDVVKKYNNISRKGFYSDEEKEQMQSLAEKIKEEFPELIDSEDSYTGQLKINQELLESKTEELRKQKEEQYKLLELEQNSSYILSQNKNHLERISNLKSILGESVGIDEGTELIKGKETDSISSSLSKSIVEQQGITNKSIVKSITDKANSEEDAEKIISTAVLLGISDGSKDLDKSMKDLGIQNTDLINSTKELINAVKKASGAVKDTTFQQIYSDISAQLKDLNPTLDDASIKKLAAAQAASKTTAIKGFGDYTTVFNEANKGNLPGTDNTDWNGILSSVLLGGPVVGGAVATFINWNDNWESINGNMEEATETFKAYSNEILKNVKGFGSINDKNPFAQKANAYSQMAAAAFVGGTEGAWGTRDSFIDAKNNIIDEFNKLDKEISEDPDMKQAFDDLLTQMEEDWKDGIENYDDEQFADYIAKKLNALLLTVGQNINQEAFNDFTSKASKETDHFDSLTIKEATKRYAELKEEGAKITDNAALIESALGLFIPNMDSLNKFLYDNARFFKGMNITSSTKAAQSAQDTYNLVQSRTNNTAETNKIIETTTGLFSSFGLKENAIEKLIGALDTKEISAANVDAFLSKYKKSAAEEGITLTDAQLEEIKEQLSKEGILDLYVDTTPEAESYIKKLQDVQKAFKEAQKDFISTIVEQEQDGSVSLDNFDKMKALLEEQNLDPFKYFKIDDSGKITADAKALKELYKDQVAQQKLKLQQKIAENEVTLKQLAIQKSQLEATIKSCEGQSDQNKIAVELANNMGAAARNAWLYAQAINDIDPTIVQKALNGIITAKDLTQEQKNAIKEEAQLRLDAVNAQEEQAKQANTALKSEVKNMDNYGQAVMASFNKGYGEDTQKKIKETAKNTKDLADKQKTLNEKIKEYNELLYGEKNRKSTLDPLYNFTEAINSFNDELSRSKDLLSDAKTIDEATDALNRRLSATHNLIVEETARQKIIDEGLSNFENRFKNGTFDYEDKINNKSVSVKYSDYMKKDARTGKYILDQRLINESKFAKDFKDELEDEVSTYNKYVDELLKSRDNVRKAEEEALELRRDALKKYTTMEDQLASTLKEAYQKEVTDVKEKYEMIKKADDDYLNALKDAVDKQRKLREMQTGYEDLADKEKKLALMQRDTSGANQVETASLEKDIKKDRQSMLDKEVDNILDGMSKMYNELAETRSVEIELKDALLNNNLYWNQQAEALGKSFNNADEYAQFIAGLSQTYAEATTTKQAQLLDEYAQTWQEATTNMALNAMNVASESGDAIVDAITFDSAEVKQLITETSETFTQEADRMYNTAADKFADAMKKAIDAINDATEALNEAAAAAESYDYTDTSSGEEKSPYSNERTGSYKGAVNSYHDAMLAIGRRIDYNDTGHKLDSVNSASDAEIMTGRRISKADIKTNTKKKPNLSTKEIMKTIFNNPGETLFNSDKGNEGTALRLAKSSGSNLYRIKIDGETYYLVSQSIPIEMDLTNKGAKSVVIDQGVWGNGKFENGSTGFWYEHYGKKVYATGGLVDYTGPAWVDGSKTKPEAFLSAEDTERLGKAAKILSDIPALNYSSTDSSNLAEKSGDTNIQITLNVDKINSELDMEKWVKRIKEEVVSAAKPIGTTVIRR